MKRSGAGVGVSENHGDESRFTMEGDGDSGEWVGGVPLRVATAILCIQLRLDEEQRAPQNPSVPRRAIERDDCGFERCCHDAEKDEELIRPSAFRRRFEVRFHCPAGWWVVDAHSRSIHVR